MPSSCTFLEESPAEVSLACSSTFIFSKAGASSFIRDNTLDVFIYDSQSGLLDAYQRVDAATGRVSVNSTSGRKIAVFAANLNKSLFSYDSVLSYKKLCEITQRLSDEDVLYPVLCGQCTFDPGGGRTHPVTLEPLSCKIMIHSIKVDFSGRPYSGESLTDMKAYLINVNASCSIADTTRRCMTDIVNCGFLDEKAVGAMASPQMLFCPDPTSGCSLYCYPYAPQDGPGSLFGPTRLVIEGQIRGNTYYYPINLDADCMRRGRNCIYDITLTRSGGIDPDSALLPQTVLLKVSVSEWTEYDECIENY